MDNAGNDIDRSIGMANGMAQKVIDQVTDKAGDLADKIRSTADYVRGNDVKAMGRDVEDLVKRYPGQALLAAAVVGFFIARAMRTQA